MQKDGKEVFSMEAARKRTVARLALLFTVAYMVSYITRINFGAVISEMELATGIGREHLSLSVTGSFITYGLGQIFSGFFGDRVSPKRLILIGFLLATLMNGAVPLCKSPYAMLAVWCVNGFAQSLMWPPLVKLMSSLLTSGEYSGVTIKVSLGSQVGTILIYLVSPLLIGLFGWRAVFLFSAAAGAVMLLVWWRLAPDIAPVRVGKEQGSAATGAARRALLSASMPLILLAIVLIGALRDGVNTWMPTYVSDTFSLGSEISILSGVVLPIVSSLCFLLSSFLYGRRIKNPVVCAILFFFVGLFASLALYSANGRNAVLSVLLLALLYGSMHGANLMLVCMIPAFFKRYGNVSLASGVINSCVYVGSAISTYGIAALSGTRGWGFTILVWVGIATAGLLLLLVSLGPWRRKFMEREE